MKGMKEQLTEQELEFLQESNHIEGEYSEKAMEDSIKAWNYAKKIVLEDKGNITLDFVLAVHKILMKNINSLIAGKFRKVQVGVMTKEGFKEAVNHKDILKELRLLNNKGIYPWYLGEEQIKVWHIQFEHIHPFEDGNGRTGRILMNIQRLKVGLPLLIIHIGEEQQNYYKWFKHSQKDVKKDGNSTLVNHLGAQSQPGKKATLREKGSVLVDNQHSSGKQQVEKKGGAGHSLFHDTSRNKKSAYADNPADTTYGFVPDLNEEQDKNVCKIMDEYFNMGFEKSRAEALTDEIKWLKSVLDTRHIAETSRWIIEGRISKLEKQRSRENEKTN